MNPFDQSCRYQMTWNPPRMLAWLLRLPPDAFSFRRWIDTRTIPFPGETDRTCDTVAFIEQVSAGGVPWLWPIEFQVAPDAEMFGRLMEYLGTLWRVCKPHEGRGDRFSLSATVVNLTGRGNASREMRFPEANVQTVLQIVERNLADESAADAVEAIESGAAPAAILPWIPLMRGGSDLAVIRKWIELAGREPDIRRRGDYGGLALVFAEKSADRDLWKAELKGWNVIVSQQVQEWQAEARIEARAEARAEAAELLVMTLESRFGNLPPDVLQNVRGIHDPTRQRYILSVILQATTIADVLPHIDQP